jgi:hypothetical protein
MADKLYNLWVPSSGRWTNSSGVNPNYPIITGYTLEKANALAVDRRYAEVREIGSMTSQPDPNIKTTVSTAKPKVYQYECPCGLRVCEYHQVSQS